MVTHPNVHPARGWIARTGTHENRAMQWALFEMGAPIYDFLTAQSMWREQIAKVLDYAPTRRPLRVLDLGCGPGESTFILAERLGPGSTVTGIDLSRSMIARALDHHRRRHPGLEGVHFQQADATRLPFEDGRFDLALGHSFLYLVPDRPAVLREVHRVLAPGGRLVLMEPNAEGSLPRATWKALPNAMVMWRHPIDAPRFAASILLWRLVSAANGQLSGTRAEGLFRDAGFHAVACHPTLAGLGLHCVGEA